MAKKDWYTVYDRGDHFFVQKIDPDDRTPVTDTENPGTMPGYKISKSNDKLSQCECWAGSKWCRHKAMIVRFQQTDRINQRWLHNFDKDKWIEPMQQEA